MPYTRLGLDGYGVRRAGSFADKTPDVPSAHPVGVITRLSLDGYMARRVGAFSGKTSTDEPVVTPSVTPAGGVGGRRRRYYVEHKGRNVLLNSLEEAADFVRAIEAVEPPKRGRRAKKALPVISIDGIRIEDVKVEGIPLAKRMVLKARNLPPVELYLSVVLEMIERDEEEALFLLM